MQAAEEDQLIEDFHFFVEAALFGQVADAVEACAVKRLFKQVTRPESGIVMPIIMRMELVLPAPLGRGARTSGWHRWKGSGH